MSAQRSLQRLVKAFVGRPDPPKPPKPTPKGNATLPEMMRDLTRLSDRVFGRYAFSREPLRGKFTPAQMDRLTAQANACGIEWADKIAAEYGRDPFQIAAALSVNVDYPMQPAQSSHVVFAQFVPPRKISIFRHNLNKVDELLEIPPVRKAMGSLRADAVLLAHELFHVIEEREKAAIFTRTEKVELWAPRPFHNRSTIHCLSEIAGMAFASRLTNLHYSPYVLDVFFIYGYAPAPATCLYEEIIELAVSLGEAQAPSYLCTDAVPPPSDLDAPSL